MKFFSLKKQLFGTTEHFHFVGIGGSGMNGIAELILNLGYKVSGSDIMESDSVKRLKKLGAKIYIGHQAKNIEGADVLVYSSAVSKDNPEYVEAKKRKIPVIPRAEMLAELMRLKRGIAVAGTHGKTSTTSLLGSIFYAAKWNPTTIIGGKFFNIGANAKLGKGEYLICEADESDGSFLKLNPEIAIVTNIDTDHLDHYGTFDNLKNTFLEFINKVPFYGYAVVCTDNKVIKSLMPNINKRVITYGIKSNADFRAVDIKKRSDGMYYSLVFKNETIADIKTASFGTHNVLNSLAAVAVAYNTGISIEKIKKGLAGFKGVERRLELKGIVDNIKIIDDYGHHPTEIKATIDAIHKGKGKLIVVFQPHRYTRTKILYKDFASSFGKADFVYITDIYPAGEKPIKGVSAKLIYNEIVKKRKRNVKYIPVKEDIPNDIAGIVKQGDTVLTLGAGDIKNLGIYIIKRLNENL